jgi:hypothetical protein
MFILPGPRGSPQAIDKNAILIFLFLLGVLVFYISLWKMFCFFSGVLFFMDLFALYNQNVI